MSKSKILSEIQLLNPDIKIVYHSNRSYFASYCDRRNRAVHVGTYENNEINIATTLLHEIGHLKCKKSSVIADEKAAWAFAAAYAKKNNIPFNPQIMVDAFSIYEIYDRVIRQSIGSLGLSKRQMNVVSSSFLKKIMFEFVKIYTKK